MTHQTFAALEFNRNGMRMWKNLNHLGKMAVCYRWMFHHVRRCNSWSISLPIFTTFSKWEQIFIIRIIWFVRVEGILRMAWHICVTSQKRRLRSCFDVERHSSERANMMSKRTKILLFDFFFLFAAVDKSLPELFETSLDESKNAFNRAVFPQVLAHIAKRWTVFLEQWPSEWFPIVFSHKQGSFFKSFYRVVYTLDLGPKICYSCYFLVIFHQK